MICLVHIGLPLDRIPAEDQPIIAQRLADLRQEMRDAGYHYEIVHAHPSTGLEEFRRRLLSPPADGIIIGSPLLHSDDLLHFLEQIIDTTHQLRPTAKVMFFNHSEDVQTTVERWHPRP